MGVFQVFKIEQMVPNRAKHQWPISHRVPTVPLSQEFDLKKTNPLLKDLGKFHQPSPCYYTTSPNYILSLLQLSLGEYYQYIESPSGSERLFILFVSSKAFFSWLNIFYDWNANEVMLKLQGIFKTFPINKYLVSYSLTHPAPPAPFLMSGYLMLLVVILMKSVPFFLKTIFYRPFGNNRSKCALWQ